MDLSFPRRGIRQIRDRSEKSMLFSERSSIFSSLSPENSMNFRGTRPLPSKIACDFRRQRSVSSDSRVFSRAMNGSGKTSPWAPISDRCLRFFIEPFMLLSPRKSHAIFGGDRVDKKNANGREPWKKRPSPAVENRKRFSTAGGGSPPIRVFFSRFFHVFFSRFFLRAIYGSAKKSSP